MATVNGTNGDDFIHTSTDGLSSPDGIAHLDIATATDFEDTIYSGGGGNDIIHAGAGDDTITFSDDLDSTDQIFGGDGFDILVINEQTDITFAAGSLNGVDRITLPQVLLPVNTAGFQSITMNDDNYADTSVMQIDASALNADTFFTFDGSAETSAHFQVYGGHGDDYLTGSQQGDTFYVDNGGADTVISGGGHDVVAFGSTLTAADTVIGDPTRGMDLYISGSAYAGLTFSTTTIQNVSLIVMDSDDTLGLTMNDFNLANGQLLTIDATVLQAGRTFVFNGSGETNGRFYLYGGGGADNLTGGARADTFDLYQPPGIIFGGPGWGGGADQAFGGGGADVFLGVTAEMSIDGGAGMDTVYVSSGTLLGFEVAYGADTIHNVEKLVVSGLSFTLDDGNVAAGATLIVQGSPGLVDGAAETDGHFKFVQDAGDGHWIGGALSDSFDIRAGFRETIAGGGGDDLITAGALFDSFDQFDGGGGTDTLSLNGDYAATPLAISAEMLVDVEKIVLAGGHSYDLTTDDANVGPNGVLVVNAAALGAADKETFDGAAETDGRFNFVAGLGIDRLTGGARADVFNFRAEALKGSDTVVGGTGADRLNFTTAGTVTANGLNHVTGVEQVALADGTNSLTLTDAFVASATGHVVKVTGGSGRDTIDGSAVVTGANRLVVEGGGGADLLTASSGVDRFVYAGAADSAGAQYDTVRAFDFGADRFDIPGGPGKIKAIDTAVTTGQLDRGAGFDAELHAALNGHLHANRAILFTADAGDLHGQTFLVVDLNGAGGYQAGQDLVIHLNGAVGTLSAADFV